MIKETIIFGKDGFIGSALAKRKLPAGLYYFDSPSSVVLFDENTDWCIRKTVDGFLDLLTRVRITKEYLVFPSSATVYNKNTSYAHTKAALEELWLASGVPALCLRITAGYGPGEKHKGRFASVVYQWCQQMKRGERPVIFGDGTQTRDFIYEDDIADNIAALAKVCKTGIVDIGSGINTSFNKVVEIINKVLETNIFPVYAPKPEHYVSETKVNEVPCVVNLEHGIRKIIESL